MSTQDRAAGLRARVARGQQSTGEATHRHRPADAIISGDVIPDPESVTVWGELTPDEQHQLDVCERAVDNLNTAAWLAGKALQNIRDRKLYRLTHYRFEDYVAERWEISVRTAYQMIEEWPLAERLNLTLGRPVTASHVRALLPVASKFGLEAATTLYMLLRERCDADEFLLTASLTKQIVAAVLKAAGRRAEEVRFRETAQRLIVERALPLPKPPLPPAATNRLQEGANRAAPATPSVPAAPEHSHPPGGGQDPSASSGQGLDYPLPGPSLRNFADDNAEVTTSEPGRPVSNTAHGFSHGDSDGEIVAALEGALSRVQNVEQLLAAHLPQAPQAPEVARLLRTLTASVNNVVGLLNDCNNSLS